jgi:hypothetical protein
VNAQPCTLWRSVRKTDGSVDPYCIQTVCGGYTVCLIVLHGVKTYEAWKGMTRLGSRATPEQAKEIVAGDRATK